MIPTQNGSLCAQIDRQNRANAWTFKESADYRNVQAMKQKINVMDRTNKWLANKRKYENPAKYGFSIC